jgi:hypothetical protein
MDFPAYVPAAVRTQVASMIEGDSWEPIGWAESLASAKRDLNRIEEAIEIKTRRGEVEYLPDLRKQRVEVLNHCESLASEVDCLRRLVHDARMAEAYALLTREFTEDQQWSRFTSAAWAARGDYSIFRTRLKRAEELKAEIADCAVKLKVLLNQFSETGVNAPNEFYSVPALLRATDNSEMRGRNLHMWRSMRGYVLGEASEENRLLGALTGVTDEQSCVPKISVQYLESGKKVNIDPLEEVRNTLCYAWQTAPEFPSLLASVAKAAQTFIPTQTGMIGAAIESRQRNPKTEYLRAIGNLLTEVYEFALTVPLMKAIAIVANVAINHPGIDVTYDDVRKILTPTSGKSVENSGDS